MVRLQSRIAVFSIMDWTWSIYPQKACLFIATTCTGKKANLFNSQFSRNSGKKFKKYVFCTQLPEKGCYSSDNWLGLWERFHNSSQLYLIIRNITRREKSWIDRLQLRFFISLSFVFRGIRMMHGHVASTICALAWPVSALITKNKRIKPRCTFKISELDYLFNYS